MNLIRKRVGRLERLLFVPKADSAISLTPEEVARIAGLKSKLLRAELKGEDTPEFYEKIKKLWPLLRKRLGAESHLGGDFIPLQTICERLGSIVGRSTC